MSNVATLQEVRSWTLDERLDFVFQVWDDILDAGWHPTLTPELKAELDRRLAAYHANPDDVRTWEQIEVRLGRQP